MPAGYTQIKGKAALQAMTNRVATAHPKLKATLEQYAPVVDRAQVFAMRLGDSVFNNAANIIVPPGGGKPDDMNELYAHVKLPLNNKARKSPATRSEMSRGRRRCD